MPEDVFPIGNGPVRIPWRSFHPTGDGSLGNIKTEHKEFAMYARCSPGWVLNDHTEYLFPNLFRCSLPSHLPLHLGNQSPVHAKTTPVPVD